MEKSELRKKVLAERKMLNEGQIKQLSSQIFKNIINIDLFDEANIIFVYLPYNHEVDTKMLIEYAFATGKRVCVPYICDETSMEAVEIMSLANLQKNSFGILEPIDCSTAIDKNQIDFTILPGSVYDYSFNRIGYGKGYYDSFLVGMKTIKVGLAFDFQIVESVPVYKTDVAMDIIVTPTRVLKKCK